MLTKVRTEVNVVHVQSVSFSVILDAPNADALLRAYAEECLVPDATPQRLIYEAMEGAGALKCFAAYAEGTLLIGFCSILVARMPHTGHLLATGESIFVDSACRDTGAGNLLINAAEQYADSICAPLSWLPRVDSAFDKVLSRRPGYSRTHSQYTRWQA